MTSEGRNFPPSWVKNTPFYPQVEKGRLETAINCFSNIISNLWSLKGISR